MGQTMIKIVPFVTALCLSAQLAAQTPLATPGEAVSRPLLNSERIAEDFGSYGIDVLSADDGVRVSSLYSLQGEIRICRTFAVVRYPHEIDAELSLAHQAILAGQSIGAVFTQRGWAVEKLNRYFGVIPSSERVAGLMGGLAPQPLAVHIYDLFVSQAGRALLYATIAEVHHPDYLTLDQLRGIYGEVSITAAGTDPDSGPMLALTRQKMN